MDNLNSFEDETLYVDDESSNDSSKTNIYLLSTNVEEEFHQSRNQVSQQYLDEHVLLQTSEESSIMLPINETLMQKNFATSTPIKRKVPGHVPCFNWSSSKPIPGFVSPSTSNHVTPGKSNDQSPDQALKKPINGVNIEFPYTIYPVQLHMINQLIKALKTATHCLLESPTGTGKTLALLCSTLAWQEQERETLRELKIQASELSIDKSNSVKGKKPGLATATAHQSVKEKSYKTVAFSSDSSDSDDDVFQVPKRKKVTERLDHRSEMMEVLPHSEVVSPQEASEEVFNTSEFDRAPKIFYCTRTHKQIAQVVNQLRQTAYGNNVKMTILSARDHSCVNRQVLSQPNLTEACQALIDPVMGEGCSFYTGSNKITSHQSLRSCGLPVVYDIEDLVTAGQRFKMCPYFTMRNLTAQSDIIFCPYSYLLDPVIRESMNINVAKSVVIMDEGHNIEDNCREAASLLLKQVDLEEAMQQCSNHIKMDNNSEQYYHIRAFLESLNSWMMKTARFYDYSKGNQSSDSITGRDLVNWFETEGINPESFVKFKENVNIINQKRMENPEENQALSGVVKQVTSGIIVVLGYLFNEKITNTYEAYFLIEPPSTSGSPSAQKWWKYTLHLVCLSPAVVFGELLNARTIILASGTLSPLGTFKAELGAEFPTVIRGWQNVSRRNMFVTVIANGPQKVTLKGVFENANTYAYQDELGRAILETIKKVPHGVLCFLPSYSMMEKLKIRWDSTGIFDDMEMVKQVYFEPRKKVFMNGVMSNFRERIKISMSNPEEIGGIMFGVFRGKIAEGIDFSDDLARAVISVGIPFLNMQSKEVGLKIKYNNRNVTKNSLSGQKWYMNQAFRALNQALGRGIRHKNDWAALILIESRLCQGEAQLNLPKWIQLQMKTFERWEDYLGSLAEYTDRMQSCDEQAAPEYSGRGTSTI